MFSKTMPKAYCCEPVDHIPGYEQAVASPELFACHHRFEEMGLSREDLKEMGLYYNRPACELVFVPFSEHNHFHSGTIPSEASVRSRFQKGQVPTFTDTHRQRISEAKRGVKQSPEHIMHVREAQKATRASRRYRDGARSRMVGRFESAEARQLQADHMSKLWKDDKFRRTRSAALSKAINADAEAYNDYKATGGVLSWKEWRHENSPYVLYQAAGGTLSRASWIRHGRPEHD